MPVAVGPDPEYAVHLNVFRGDCRSGVGCPEDLRRTGHKAECRGDISVECIRLVILQCEHHEPDLIVGNPRRVAYHPHSFADGYDRLLNAGSLHHVDRTALRGPDPLAACLVDGPDNQAHVRVPPEHVRDFALEFDDLARVVCEQGMVSERGARKEREPQYGQGPNCTDIEHLDIPLSSMWNKDT